MKKNIFLDLLHDYNIAKGLYLKSPFVFILFVIFINSNQICITLLNSQSHLLVLSLKDMLNQLGQF